MYKRFYTSKDCHEEEKKWQGMSNFTEEKDGWIDKDNIKHAPTSHIQLYEYD